MKKKNFPKGWYPSANTTNHYVYLNSLKDDNPSLANAVENLLKVNPQSPTDFDEYYKLTEAIAFLKTCAQNERKKEQEFIKTKISPNYATESVEGIIKAINERIIGAEEFQRRLNTEIQRHKKKGKGGWSATQGYAGYIQSALKQVYGVLKDEEKEENNPKNMAKMTRTILLNQVFKILAPFGVGANECATIVGLLQSQITPFLLEQVEKGDVLFVNKTQISKTKLEKLIKNTPEYKQLLGNLRKNTQTSINRVETLRQEASKILQGFLGEDNLTEGKTKETIDPKIQETKYLQMLTEAAKERVDASVLNYNITGNRGHGGEFRVLSDLKIMIANSLGSKGGKTDVRRYSFPIGEIGTAIQKNNKIKKLQEQMDEITDAKTQSLFTERGKEFENIYKQMSQEVENAQKDLKDKEKLFIEHYSVKDYVSTSDASRTFEGFKGVENMKMTDFISAISSLSSVGFDVIDINWLTTCLLNTADAALGVSNLPSLEKNLSIFATMLLFDDGLAIAKEAVNNPYPAINALHIFPLNGIYVPSSVVMEEIANQLESKSNDMRKAATITINTGSVDFPKELANLTEEQVFNYHRWNAIREKQKAAMRIRIEFLANFFDIISRL